MMMAKVGQVNRELSKYSSIIFHAFSFLFSRGLPFIASLIVAKLLLVADFGRYMTVLNLFFSLCLVVDMGFALATVRTVAHRSGDRNAAASVVLASLVACGVLGLLVAGVIGFGAGLISIYVLDDPSLKVAVLAGSLYVPASAFASTCTAILQGSRRYRELALAGFVGGTIFLALVTVAAFKADVLLVIWSASIGSVARAVVLMLAVAPDALRAMRGRHTAACLKRDFLELWHVALPASLAGLTFAPVNTLMMSNLYRNPNGAVECAWLGLALQFFSIVMVLPGMLTQYALPTFAALFDERSRDRRLAQLRRFTMLAIGICLCMAAPVAIWARPILSIIAPQFSEGFPALRWMMISALVAAPQGVLSNYLIAMSYNWTRVLTRLLWAAVLVGFVLALPNLNAGGLSIAYAAAWTTILASQIVVVFYAERAR